MSDRPAVCAQSRIGRIRLEIAKFEQRRTCYLILPVTNGVWRGVLTKPVKLLFRLDGTCRLVGWKRVMLAQGIVLKYCNTLCHSLHDLHIRAQDLVIEAID